MVVTDESNTYKAKKGISFITNIVFILKISIAFITVYLSIALGYAAFLPYTYQRERENFAHSLATSIMQPYMDVFGYNKISHFYDWRVVPISDFAYNQDIQQQAVRIPSSQITGSSQLPAQRVDYTSDLSQSIYDLRPSDTAIVLKPVSHKGQWSVIKCIPVRHNSEEILCLKSNLLHTDAVKFSIDGKVTLWGVDTNNTIIPLQTSSLIKAYERRTLPMI